MRCLLLGFASGIGLLQTRASLPSLWLAGLLLAMAAFAALLCRRMPAAWHRAAARIACGALLGFLWAALMAHHYLSDELPVELEGQDLVVTGVVDSLPYRFERGLRFNLALDTVLDEESHLFDEAEKAVFEQWRALNYEAQYL